MVCRKIALLDIFYIIFKFTVYEQFLYFHIPCYMLCINSPFNVMQKQQQKWIVITFYLWYFNVIMKFNMAGIAIYICSDKPSSLFRIFSRGFRLKSQKFLYIMIQKLCIITKLICRIDIEIYQSKNKHNKIKINKFHIYMHLH